LKVLEISNIHPSVHDGTYQLNADDKITICEVRIKPVAARFDQRPPENVVFDMDKQTSTQMNKPGSVTIECLVDKLDVNVKWFRGNEELVPDANKEKFEIIDDGPLRSLIIHDVGLDDAGDYFCSLGNQVAKTQLQVMMPVAQKSPRTMQKTKIEPKFEKIEVFEGKGLAIGIDLESAKDQIELSKWFKNDQELLQTGNFFQIKSFLF
jgi:hypothetical protein